MSMGDGPTRSSDPDGAGKVVPVITLRRKYNPIKGGGFYFFVWPFIFVLGLLIWGFVFNEPFSPFLVAILAVTGAIAFIFMDRHEAAGQIFQLSMDAAVLSYDTLPPERIAMIDFGHDTVVDVVLSDTCGSEEFGNLYGRSFSDGKTGILISSNDGWELWDIQDLREPIYSIIEQHGLERGKVLQQYQEGFGSVPR